MLIALMPPAFLSRDVLWLAAVVAVAALRAVWARAAALLGTAGHAPAAPTDSASS